MQSLWLVTDGVGGGGAVVEVTGGLRGTAAAAVRPPVASAAPPASLRAASLPGAGARPDGKPKESACHRRACCTTTTDVETPGSLTSTACVPTAVSFLGPCLSLAPFLFPAPSLSLAPSPSPAPSLGRWSAIVSGHVSSRTRPPRSLLYPGSEIWNAASTAIGSWTGARPSPRGPVGYAANGRKSEKWIEMKSGRRRRRKGSDWRRTSVSWTNRDMRS
ncbi:hypothetical protein EYF80_009448 [Liparis tanakae]|uniref:Uncharacterized protein n=1 Tax=Liparis tanakae TaxID=230148 RepID=A0A4Z2ISD5_9TELE|nr:hypothetical protein EYF80_009448 [Liparis tanakae]